VYTFIRVFLNRRIPNGLSVIASVIACIIILCRVASDNTQSGESATSFGPSSVSCLLHEEQGTGTSIPLTPLSPTVISPRDGRPGERTGWEYVLLSLCQLTRLSNCSSGIRQFYSCARVIILHRAGVTLCLRAAYRQGGPKMVGHRLVVTTILSNLKPIFKKN